MQGTALHLACAAGRLKTTLLLLAEGADVSIRNKHGWNCLNLAIANKHRYGFIASLLTCAFDIFVKVWRIAKMVVYWTLKRLQF